MSVKLPRNEGDKLIDEIAPTKEDSFLIYIVDDDRINLSLIGRFLHKSGFNVVTNTDIFQAIREICQLVPDLILLDILMPDINGFTACSLLKKSSKTKDIPIIFLTALDSSEDKIKGLELGAIDYITKPIHYPELLSRVNTCLKISNLANSLKTQNRLLKSEIEARKNAQISLQKAEKKLKTIINNHFHSMVVLDLDGKVLFLNEEAEKLFNRTHEQMVGNTLGVPLELNKIGELEILRSQSELITVEMRAVPIIWNDDNAYLLSFIDISEKKKMEQELKILYRASEQSPASIVITNVEGNIQYVNSKFETVSGYKKEEVIGKNPRVLKSGYTHETDYKNLWKTISNGKEWQGEFHNKRKNGELYWERALISPIFNSVGAITHYIAVKEDITEEKQQQLLLKYQAKYDYLTKIPNRNYALEKVHKLLNQAEENKYNTGLMFIDLDHFKEVNDTLGHDFGDELLVEVTMRMKGELRSTDLLARLGGDEFFIVIPIVQSRHELQIIANKIIQILKKPFYIFQEKIFISASIGITIFPEDGQELKQLIRNADLAMYQSKKNGRDQFQFYQYDMNKVDIGKSTLEKNFLNAISNDEFKIVYQPVIDIFTGKIVSAEALVRWENKDLGLIYPEKFIPFLEKNGLILVLEQWILETIINDLKFWERYEDLLISINLSEYQFKNAKMVKNIKDLTGKKQLRQCNLCIEIKEEYLEENKKFIDSIFNDINSINIEFCLDNFGAGLTSISNLSKFPFKHLKIDQSLVQSLPRNSQNKNIIESIIAVANILNIKVTAKGIESKAQLDSLRALGCHYGQGYFFSQPLSALNFITYLTKNTN
ncbi:EAL domain-containing protein [Cyanobacterium aponinum]|uniref:Response regulator receiver modulated diguanylate cyclase/phosphodiesterase with PAS/PAC sensor(S) n=1 Tax=Cyanobacterium aponinum (strain PCC 10605) TaxID=755178 RepID=K9Z1S6_CYAAP|nr:EAL domain-containing protein [Cyanobacterium aponinum]AFZ52318.1 response regulator receiver modulated diguanylate cyclase/phosphodiesterase with PAS/PAC sensor(s) [Cyanobacterium aponinum PCC 10605]